MLNSDGWVNTVCLGAWLMFSSKSNCNLWERELTNDSSIRAPIG